MNRPGPPGGRQHTQKFRAARGATARTDKAGGVNAIRCRREVLIPKLVPFAKSLGPTLWFRKTEFLLLFPIFSRVLYNVHRVLRLLWPCNSLYLNMIEPCWMGMKMETTKRGTPSIRKEVENSWKKCWKDMSQEWIQRQILRVIRHILMIILLEGDNKYKDGPFVDGKVAGETGEWVHLGGFDLHLLGTM